MLFVSLVEQLSLDNDGLEIPVPESPSSDPLDSFSLQNVGQASLCLPLPHWDAPAMGFRTKN
jgi:hypothetical protein